MHIFFLIDNNDNKDTPTDTSWLSIIFELFLCVLCPFLIIPYWYISSKCRENGITLQRVVTNLYVIAFLFIISAAPIITALNVVTYGVFETYQKYGGLLAVTLFEIFFALKYLWSKKIKKKLKLKTRNRTALWKKHQGLFPVYVIAFCILFFVLILSDINNFFAFLVLLFGFYGMFKGLID